MLIRAYAKINIGLDITGRRDDGYHEIDTIMQTINLYDEIEIERREDDEDVLTCSDPELSCGEDNLIMKAVRLLDVKGLDIHLTKNIPSQAGLGGGSSDAGAVLLALNRFLRLGYRVEELAAMSVKLGADVPYCVTRGTCRCRGIGEIITELPFIRDCCVVIDKPEEGMNTREIFGRLDDIGLTKEDHPRMDEIEAAIYEGNLRKMCGQLGNVLEKPVSILLPQIREIKEKMYSFGALGAQMSGSGSAVYGIFDNRQKAEECAGSFDNGILTEII